MFLIGCYQLWWGYHDTEMIHSPDMSLLAPESPQPHMTSGNWWLHLVPMQVQQLLMSCCTAEEQEAAAPGSVSHILSLPTAVSFHMDSYGSCGSGVSSGYIRVKSLKSEKLKLRRERTHLRPSAPGRSTSLSVCVCRWEKTSPRRADASWLRSRSGAARVRRLPAGRRERATRTKNRCNQISESFTRRNQNLIWSGFDQQWWFVRLSRYYLLLSCFLALKHSALTLIWWFLIPCVNIEVHRLNIKPQIRDHHLRLWYSVPFRYLEVLPLIIGIGVQIHSHWWLSNMKFRIDKNGGRRDELIRL